MKYLIWCFLFINILFSSSIDFTKDEKEYLKNKSQLLFMNQDNFHPFSYTSNGIAKGYSPDILRLIGKKLNKEVVFVKAKTWDEQIQMIKNNQIDAFSYMVKNPKREKFIEFSSKPFFSFSIGFATNKNFSISSIEDLKDKRIAVVKQSFLHEHIKENFPNLKLVLTNSVAESLDLIAQNKADTTVDNVNTLNYFIDLGWLSQLRIIHLDDFKLPYINKLYMAVSKENKILMGILEKTKDSLDNKTIKKLKQKWLISRELSVPLNDREKEYLENKAYLSVLSLKNFQPFSYRQDGEVKGYSVDTIKLMGKILGKEIRFIKKPWNEQLQMLKEGNLDIIPHIAINEQRKKFVSYTDFKHISFLIGFVLNKNNTLNSMADLKDKKLAVVNKYYLHDHLKKNFPHIKLHLVTSTEEAIDAVVKGEAYAAVDNIPTINYFIQERWLSNLKINTIKDFGLSFKTQMPMGVTKGNEILKSILEKTNRALDAQKVRELKNKWLYINEDKKDIGLSEIEKQYIRQNPILKVQNLKTFPPFNFNENNIPYGYAIDYMEIISKITGLKVEYISNKPWQEYLNMLQKGEVDIIPHIAINEERKKIMDFTDFILIEYSIGFAVNEEQKITSMNDLKDKVIAVVNKTFLHTYLKNNFPNQSLLITESSEKSVEAVAKGYADAAIGNIPSLEYFINKAWLSNIKTVTINDLGISTKVKLPMGIQKNNKTLKSILRKAHTNISGYELMRLKEKWINIDKVINNITADLSKAEIKYLKNKDKIKMCVLPDWLPFEQIDKSGKHKGIGADIMQKISKYLDKKIELVPTAKWSDSIEYIKNRKCDILPMAMDVPSRRAYMDFTKPYISEPFVVATKTDKLFIKDENALSDKKIGVTQSFAFIEVLKDKNPKIKIIEVKNAKDGLEKVQSGELYAFIDTMPSIGYLIQKHSFYDIKIAGKLPFDVHLSVASRNDEPLLNSIMQKAFDKISKDEIRAIIGEWITIKVSQEFDYKLLWQISALFVVVILAILYWNRSMAIMNKKLLQAHSEIHEQQKMVNRYVLILATDTKGIITDVNQAYCNFIGYSKDELIGKDHSIMKHPDMDKEVFKHMWENISKDNVWNGEIKNLSKNKETIWFNMNVEPIFKEGKKIGYRSISENITNKKRIEELSITDKLTGLFNRLKLDEILNMKIKEFSRYKKPFSVIILDIDNFKSVNDIYGHDIGDKTLITIAKVLKNNLRTTDYVGRWGGEEFVIICENTKLEGAYTLAEHLRKKVQDTRFEAIGSKTISLGVSEICEGDTINTIFKRVDVALYEAKNTGKNKVIKT